jgi:xanthine/uracil permease
VLTGSAAVFVPEHATACKRQHGWIDGLMHPIVTGSVVAIIGFNLAGAAVSEAIRNDLAIDSVSDWCRVMTAAVTFLTAALVSIRLRGFLQMVPILVGLVVGCAVAASCGSVGIVSRNSEVR